MKRGQHRPESLTFFYLERALKKRPWLGMNMIFIVCAFWLWYYTIKAWISGGMVIGIFMMVFAVEGTALCWVMMKFAKLSTTWKHEQEER